MNAVPEEEEEEEEVGKFSSDSRRFRLRSRGLGNGQWAMDNGTRIGILRDDSGVFLRG
jgi:hypothetical protein